MKIHFSFKVLLPLSAKADQTVDTFYWGANELCPSTYFLACLSSAILHKFSLPLTVLKKSHGHFAFSIVPAAFSKSIVSQLVSFHNQDFQSEKRQQSTWSMSTSHRGYFQPKNPVKHFFNKEVQGLSHCEMPCKPFFWQPCSVILLLLLTSLAVLDALYSFNDEHFCYLNSSRMHITCGTAGHPSLDNSKINFLSLFLLPRL